MRAFAEAGLPKNPVASARTDKGVSARMQVLSVRVPRDADDVLERLRPRLPEDLGLHLAREVPETFHAAWSASGKHYRYRLTREQAGSLDVLRGLCERIRGTHDFQVFHFKTSEVKPRTVRRAEVHEVSGTSVELRFEGDGFARHMVRMLVGAMTAVARGEVTREAFEAGLAEKTKFRCPVAAPEPLTLWSVDYPSEADPFTAAEREAFTWPR